MSFSLPCRKARVRFTASREFTEELDIHAEIQSSYIDRYQKQSLLAREVKNLAFALPSMQMPSFWLLLTGFVSSAFQYDRIGILYRYLILPGGASMTFALLRQRVPGLSICSLLVSHHSIYYSQFQARLPCRACAICLALNMLKDDMHMPGSSFYDPAILHLHQSNLNNDQSQELIIRISVAGLPSGVFCCPISKDTGN